MAKSKPMFSVGDLVELARFGQIPKNEEDRVYGIVVESLDSSGGSYHVPRYRIRLSGIKVLRAPRLFRNFFYSRALEPTIYKGNE